MRIYYVKTLIFADFLIISARQALSKLNIDKAKKEKTIRFLSATLRSKSVSSAFKNVAQIT